jgi:hypothetical protein
VRIVDRQNISKVLALVKMSCAGGWYGMACGQAMLRCSRCKREKKALCSPRPDVALLCCDCFPLVERELDQARRLQVGGKHTKGTPRIPAGGRVGRISTADRR